MRPDIARTLEAAADVLERDGWVQRVAHHPDGGHCVLGAIALVTGYHRSLGSVSGKLPMVACCEENEGAMHEAAREFAEFIGHDGTANIPLWNDDPLRTPEEVVKTVRAAAAEAAA
jgi:hypothetical protein